MHTSLPNRTSFLYRPHSRCWQLICGLLLFCTIWPMTSHAASTTALDPALVGALEQAFDQTAAELNGPGIVVSVSIPNRGTWISTRGLANRRQGTSMAPDDRFDIASITKIFVATVALQLVQEGWLSLDQNLDQWLPGLVPNGQGITVRELMNHTSGLYDYLDDAFLNRVEANPNRAWAPQELVSYAVAHRPYFAPGAPGQWYYSNTNYVLLGMIIERVTRATLDQEVHHRIIDPLGLKNTFFTPVDQVSGTLAVGYDGRTEEHLADSNMSFAWSVGNIISTVEDLRQFAQALFWGRLLHWNTLYTMLSFVGVDGMWGTHYLVYGLGVMQDLLGTRPGPNGQPLPAKFGVVLGHTGALAGYRSAMWYVPDTGITIVAGINQIYADPNVVITGLLRAIAAYQSSHPNM